MWLRGLVSAQIRAASWCSWHEGTESGFKGVGWGGSGGWGGANTHLSITGSCHPNLPHEDATQRLRGDTCEQHENCCAMVCIILGRGKPLPRSQPACPTAGWRPNCQARACGKESIKTLFWQRRAAAAAAAQLPSHGTADTYAYSPPLPPLLS